MSKEKQIEEIKNVLIHTCKRIRTRDEDLMQDRYAEALYNAGYHKQSENVIELPCKVGDTVYCIEHKTIHECFVKMVKSLTYENVTRFFVEAECEIESPFYSDGRKIKHGLSAVWEIEWGSWYRAFRTREEAENALTKMKGGAE